MLFSNRSSKLFQLSKVSTFFFFKLCESFWWTFLSFKNFNASLSLQSCHPAHPSSFWRLSHQWSLIRISFKSSCHFHNTQREFWRYSVFLCFCWTELSTTVFNVLFRLLRMLWCFKNKNDTCYLRTFIFLEADLLLSRSSTS